MGEISFEGTVFRIKMKFCLDRFLQKLTHKEVTVNELRINIGYPTSTLYDSSVNLPVLDPEKRVANLHYKNKTQVYNFYRSLYLVFGGAKHLDT